MTAKKSKCCANHAKLPLTVLLGIALAAAAGFASRAELACADWAALAAIGIAAAHFLLAAGDAIRICLAVKSSPLPDGFEPADRAVAAERAAALAGCTQLHARLRNLLTAWGSGATGPQVTAMASAQNVRAQAVLAAETVSIVALALVSSGFGARPELLPAGALVAALNLLLGILRFQQTACIAGYIEGRLLARIGNDTPAGAAADFAAAAAKSAAASAETLAKASASSSDILAKASSAAADTLAKAQEKAAEKLAQSQDAVAKQLDRITALASTIDQTLQLQKSVDGTLKGVTAAEEFKSTLLELKRHLADSDQLLKNAAKPRTLRLVENPAAD
jgi:hypothetical protein